MTTEAERHGLTADDLSSMTEDERAAFSAPEDDIELLQAVADAKDEANKLQDGGAEEVASAQLDEAEPIVLPAYKAHAPEDYDGQAKLLKTEKKAVHSQMMAGEIDEAEYLAREEEISERIRVLDKQQLKSEVAAEHAAQVAAATKESAQKSWEKHVAQFFTEQKKAGNDYVADADKLAEFDGLVIAYAKMAERKNMTDGSDTYKWVLQEANKTMQAKYAATTIKATTHADRRPNLALVPPVLSKLPVAAQAAVEGDEFDYLDRLDGDAHEKALARLMSDRDKYDRYLKAA